ncbi:MAG: hypothetical protein ACOCRK_07375 [bacterium]
MNIIKYSYVDGILINGEENLKKLLENFKNNKLKIYKVAAGLDNIFYIKFISKINHNKLKPYGTVMFYTNLTATANKIMKRDGIKHNENCIYYVNRKDNTLCKRVITPLTDYFYYDYKTYSLHPEAEVISVNIDKLSDIRFEKFKNRELKGVF